MSTLASSFVHCIVYARIRIKINKDVILFLMVPPDIDVLFLWNIG